MKLTKLELSGFKSFADTVTLTFDQGVTAIVGPNGCGKSNVSDAVRWVLGEQSARLLRGGKMEDVIFQGAANRRPVNVTQVSLFLDNTDGDLPIAYQEVVVTRRLSRSGHSEYLLNNAPVRLRDIQDLLRGTGLGSDAGVVIEAKMIDLLLSDRAGERRSLFEEAAGIGLYRDRKHSTERRLEETSADLQRLDDLLAEVQSQIRSLARQKGKAERHVKLTEEKFTVSVTLARRLLDELAEQAAGLTARHAELTTELPATRTLLTERIGELEGRAAERAKAEERRTAVARELAAFQVALGKVEADLTVAEERLANTTARRRRAEEERQQAELRLEQSRVEREAASEELTAADAEHKEIQGELAARSAAEEDVRTRLGTQRTDVRQMEQQLQNAAQRHRSLEGERTALEGELSSLRERATQAETHRAALEAEHGAAEARVRDAQELATVRAQETQGAADAAERSRHLVAETREREARERAERRQTEEALAQLTARRQALEELERDRVGLAPAAAALLAARSQFDQGAVLGPLSDYISAEHQDAELMERLLGDWMHAVLVRDTAAVDAVQRWHAEIQPGALVLLPVAPGPRLGHDAGPVDGRLRVEGPAEPWARALLAGSEVLDESGRALRRASGAVYLSSGSAPTGPLRRRAELEALKHEVARQEGVLSEVLNRLAETCTRLEEVERAATAAGQALEDARERERQAVAGREDAVRIVANLAREFADSQTQLERIKERLAKAETRLAQVDAELTESEVAQARLEETLGAARAALAELEAAQETAREARVHWQVREAHVAARLRSTTERLERADRTITEAEAAASALTAELAQLGSDAETLSGQQAQGQEKRADQRAALATLETTATQAEEALAAAVEALTGTERVVADLRATVELLGEEHHRLEVELTEVSASRRSIAERIETEWKAPLASLEERVELLDLDRETLESEASRIASALEAIGPVNPLAVEEHAEESKRLEFLTAQRDDLVAARQSLLQAIREIDGTARSLFVETFTAIQANFTNVFQTLFGGGECDLRLANVDDPLESEIEIHAAPRGKRTQRIHLLSSGERTLVAVSLLFSIYLTKPSPFCLMDEVDAPLDDANVGRFTNLLHEFKHGTQFLVITHNPRTMQAADAVYGVTMQEPGVSTIVGVRLGEGTTVGVDAGQPA